MGLSLEEVWGDRGENVAMPGIKIAIRSL